LHAYVDPTGRWVWVREFKDNAYLRLDLSGGPLASVDRCPVAVSGDGKWQVFKWRDSRRGNAVLALCEGDAGRLWLELASDDVVFQPIWHIRLER